MPKEVKVTLRCVACGKVHKFVGKDVNDVLAKIDKSGWHDYPNRDGGISARCPKCYSAWSKE